MIMNKISQEKQVEEFQKEWLLKTRDNVRKKFLERHEKNIQLEKKAGIKKEYMSLKEKIIEYFIEFIH